MLVGVVVYNFNLSSWEAEQAGFCKFKASM